jgi:hypothetical protein
LKTSKKAATGGLHPRARAGAIAGGVLGGAVLLALCGAWAHARRAARQRGSAFRRSSGGGGGHAILPGSSTSGGGRNNSLDLAAASAGWSAVVATEREVALGALLGSGGYASVYEARWRGTAVAVKVFAPAFGRCTDASDAMLRSDVSMRPFSQVAAASTGEPDPSFAREVCAREPI